MCEYTLQYEGSEPRDVCDALASVRPAATGSVQPHHLCLLVARVAGLDVQRRAHQASGRLDGGHHRRPLRHHRSQCELVIRWTIDLASYYCITMYFIYLTLFIPKTQMDNVFYKYTLTVILCR